MSQKQIPVLNPDYHLEKIDNEILLYSLSSTQAVYLNETAGLIWELCDGNRTIEEMIVLLVQSYPEQKAQVRSDVIATTQTLVKNGAMTLI